MNRSMFTFFIVVFFSVELISSAKVNVFTPNQEIYGTYYESHIKMVFNASLPDGYYTYTANQCPISINNSTFYLKAEWNKSTPIPASPTSCIRYTASVSTRVETLINNENLKFTRTLQVGNLFTNKIDPNNTSGQINYNSAFIYTPPSIYCGSSYPLFSYAIHNLETFYQGFYLYSDGNYYYGWMKFVKNTGSLILLEYAYEDIPNHPIAIGQTISNWNFQNKSFLTGIAYFDKDNDCLFNPDIDIRLSGIKVKINDSLYTITNSNGNYGMMIPIVEQSYTLRAEDSQTQLVQSSTCNFPVIQVQSGAQTVKVNIPMTQSICGNVEVSIAPIELGRCFRNQIPILIQNNNPNAPNKTFVRVVLPSLTSAISSSPSWLSKKGDTLYYSINTPPFLSSVKINIIDSVHCNNEEYLGVAQCIKAEILQESTCINGMNYNGSDIVSYGICQNDYFDMYIKEQGHTAAMDSTYYEIFMDDTLVKHQKILLSPNDSIKVIIPANGKSIYVRVSQDAQHPILNERSWSREGCGNWTTQPISKGYLYRNSYTRKDVLSYTECAVIRGAYDPNDKQAFPTRPDSLLRPQQEITYKIRFQNTGTDNATHITVVDTISPYLNLRSIKNVSVSHPMFLNTIMDHENRIVYFHFASIDLPFKSVDSVGSNGYIQFTISQLNSVELGSVINNKAAIYFDYNSPIITNMTSQIVGVPKVVDQQLKWTKWNGNTSLCETEKLILKPTTNGVVSYTWYDPQGMIVSQTDSLVIPNITMTQAGLYKLKLKGRIDSLVLTTSQIQVNEKPVLLSNNIQSCSGASVDLINQIEDETALNGSYSFYASLTEMPLPSSVVNTPGNFWAIKTTTSGCKDTTEINYTTQLCTNTNSSTSTPTIKIYPNPTQDFVMLETLQKASYKIISSEGKVVDIGLLNVGTQQLDTRQWSKGMYLIQLQEESSSQLYQETIIVQ